MISNPSGHCCRTLTVYLLSGLMWLVCSGCGSKQIGPPRNPTFPVTGVVLVDGQPVEMLEVSCHDVKRIGTESPVIVAADTDAQDQPDVPQKLPGSLIVAAYTDAQGKFELASYVAGDGVPEGDYVLTFLWGQLSLVSNNYGGPDKLNDRYKSPQESKVKFSVKKGTQIDLGKIELTTK